MVSPNGSQGWIHFLLVPKQKCTKSKNWKLVLSVPTVAKVKFACMVRVPKRVVEWNEPAFDARGLNGSGLDKSKMYAVRPNHKRCGDAPAGGRRRGVDARCKPRTTSQYKPFNQSDDKYE